MSGASWKIQSSTSQITRLGWRAKAAASTKVCSRQLQRFPPEHPVDVALAEMDRERGAHQYGVEILAADQSGILQAAIRRIHRGEETRRPDNLQRIDNEIEHARHENDE